MCSFNTNFRLKKGRTTNTSRRCRLRRLCELANRCFQQSSDFLTTALQKSRGADPYFAEKWHRNELAFGKTSSHVHQVGWNYRDAGHLVDKVSNAGTKL